MTRDLDGLGVYPVNREQIIAALKSAFEPLDYAYAMWEGGAVVWNRIDAWSDIDMQIDVADDRIEDAFAVLDAALASVAPVELKYRLPEPTWHGNSQAFYRLQGASPYLLIDVALIKHSGATKFLEPEIHGPAIFHFDKANLAQVPHLDWQDLDARIHRRIQTLKVTFDLMQIMPIKELNRGNYLVALGFYWSSTLRPLVEVLRMHYTPAHFDFHTYYAYYELPAEVVKRLESLYFIADPESIRQKRAEAEAWFYETLEFLEK